MFRVIIAIFCIQLCEIFAQYGELSRQKCEEYSRIDFQSEYECPTMLETRVVGGHNAKLKEFPHFALIGYAPNPLTPLNYDCGGTLISEWFVLSAAHCSKTNSGYPQQVALGMIKLPTMFELDDFGTQRVYIKEVIPHLEHDIVYNDILLLRLRDMVIFTPYVMPACLNTDLSIRKRTAEAIGFGAIGNDDIEGSEDLLKVTVELLSRKKCRKMAKPHFHVSHSMICTLNSEPDKDTCKGDSGGPLHIILEEPVCMYSVIGITSFGFGCGLEGNFSTYTNVAYFIPWIEGYVWEREY